MEQEVWSSLGELGVRELARDFYALVAEDSILRPMYPRGDLGPAEERLADFLCYRLGGLPRYIETRGHPRLRRRHFPFPIDREARDRWMELMERALERRPLPEPARAGLHDFFAETATFMMNR